MEYFKKYSTAAALFAVFLFVALAALLVFLPPGRKGGKACFKDFCFNVETAETASETARGLMFRKDLDQNSGMLFVFEEEGVYPFWMKNTLIYLDIIWIDKNGKIVFINKSSRPCLSAEALARADGNCPVINPGVIAKYVLEINAGKAEEIGLKEGDELKISY